ncbi:Ger(x)C family spore germination protein [Bacillus massiliigorillae]|uniref:Ger(x)C family spore germination protein n=1 Tax=Bacillus massiliigorillae TaxID=1243664 RepID=UPI0005AA5603|nr:Ger(x)C family spore germination protein [Bacillus massiliigorillae]
MKRNMKVLIVITCCFILSGCWDQNPLKDVKLVMSVGIDITPEGKIQNTVSIPLIMSGEGATQVTGSQIISAINDTHRAARNEIDTKISEQFDASKLKIMLLGEKYAKQDIYPGLDMFYRDPKSSVIANVLVVKGKAHDLLNVKDEESKSKSEYLSDLIKSMQASTIIPKQTRPLITDLLDPGTDLVLPLIEEETNTAKIKGIALFNGSKYTGHDLSLQESTLFLLMKDEKSKKAWLKLKIDQNRKPKMENYVIINVLKVKRKMSVQAVNPEQISAKLDYNFKIEILEYPGGGIASQKQIDALNQKVSQLLTEKANELIKKLQKSKADSLSIGRDIIAFYPTTWDKIDWKQIYPNIPIEVKVQTEILKQGIIQ